MVKMNRTAIKFDVEKVVEVVLAFGASNDRLKLLDIILTKMMEITSSDAGTLYTISEDKLHFRIMRNNTLETFQSFEENECHLPPIVLDKSNIQNISAYAVINNEIVVVEDVYAGDERFNFSGPKKYDKLTGYQTRGMLVIPICTQGSGMEEDVFGVIQLMNPLDPETKEPSCYGDIHTPPIVPAMAKIAANTLSSAIYVKELRTLLSSIAKVLTQAIDERSVYSGNHTQNVATYCERFATYLSKKFPEGSKYHFDEFHIERIVLAALLHDIGKIITPSSVMDKASRLGESREGLKYRFELKKHQLEIERLKKLINDDEFAAQMERLNNAWAFCEHINTSDYVTDEEIDEVQKLAQIKYKDADGNITSLLDEDNLLSLSIRTGTLTDAERVIMQEHVAITERLLDKITVWKYYKDVPMWARHHHEFLDQSGYRSGLSGEQIPTEARIITIMDIFDALVAKDRPYKKAVPLKKAFEILEQMANADKLDKELVGLFIESRVWEGIVDED